MSNIESVFIADMIFPFLSANSSHSYFSLNQLFANAPTERQMMGQLLGTDTFGEILMGFSGS